MFYVYLKRIKSNREYDDLVSRITWKINFVKKVQYANTGKLDSATNRPFVGQEIGNYFLVTRTNRMAKYYRPKVYSTLKIVDEGPYRTISVKVRLSILTALVVCILLIPFLLEIVTAILTSDLDSQIVVIITQALFLLIIGLLIQEEINQTLIKLNEIIT